MEKLLTQLAEQVKALNETIIAKFSTANPEQREGEKDATAKAILALQEEIKGLQKRNAVRKMIWAITGKEQAGEGEKLIKFSDYMRAVRDKRHDVLDEVAKAATGMSEGMSADGGYMVPVEVSNRIIELVQMQSIVRRLATLFPMGSKTRTIPTQLTEPVVYWTDEAATKTKTKATFGQMTQTAKKLATIVALTDELLEDSSIDMEAFIFRKVAGAFGREEDRVAFVGKVASGDPFNGIIYNSSVTAVTMDGATVGYADLVDLIFGVNPAYRPGSRFVLNDQALTAFMKLIDGNQRPIWNPGDIQSGVPGTLMGYPYETTDKFPTNLGTGTDETVAIFGNFKEGVWLSPRGQYRTDVSNSASDGTNHAFVKNETWFRFEERISIDVAQPLALSWLQLK